MIDWLKRIFHRRNPQSKTALSEEQTQQIAEAMASRIKLDSERHRNRE